MIRVIIILRHSLCTHVYQVLIMCLCLGFNACDVASIAPQLISIDLYLFHLFVRLIRHHSLITLRSNGVGGGQSSV
jgi:hypothetical protein